MQSIDTQGIRFDKLGFGTWRLKGDAARTAVESALSLGYRHIDTAEMYGNEVEVGQALAASGLPRSDLHVTTKVWHDHILSADDIRAACAASLDRLGLDHVDLYLVHWPNPAMDLGMILDTLVKLKEEGRTRAIGVANFPSALIRKAVEEIGAPLACNQVEYHALLGQQTLLDTLRAHGIPLVAYCPLAQGRLGEFPELAEIAKKHGATPAQVALKWLLDQDGVAAIPKSASAGHQQENLDALKITLDAADIHAIEALPKTRRFVDPEFGPDWD